MVVASDILDTIQASTKTEIQTLEKELSGTSGILKDQKLSIENLTKFQMQINKWNILSQLSSVALKSAGDAMRAIIQRIN